MLDTSEFGVDYEDEPKFFPIYHSIENKEFNDGKEQEPLIFHNNGDEGEVGPEDFLGSVGKEPTKLPSVAKTVGEKYISVYCSCLMPDDSR